MEVTIALLKKSVQTCSSKYLLVDGFPRKLDQGLSFEQDVAPGMAVLFFDCPEDVMQERLLERGKTSGRADDNIETIKKRFRTYIQQTKPIIEMHGSLGKLVTIDA